MSHRLMKSLAVLAASAMPALGLATATTSAAHAATTFNVKTYGAKGDGKTVDTKAINNAISAASNAGGGVVEFPNGTYPSLSIHLKSNVTLNLESGATIKAASATGFDAAESNKNDAYQDYVHSHFHDALIWGDGVSNVAFTGSGTIDGAGNLAHNQQSSGHADKAISIVNCTNFSVSGIHLNRGGWVALLTNGCNHVSFDHFTVSTASDRDGLDIISTSNVSITNSNIASEDDAIGFKADWALGKTINVSNATISNDTVYSHGNNALQFGSETCGSFTNFTFSHITITGAGKAGIGLVSMDGSHISNINYSDITMTQAAAPIFMKIGNRGRCGTHPGPGSISGIALTNVTATHSTIQGREYTSTMDGWDSSHEISNVKMTNVNLTVPGGHPASDANINPPHPATAYAPKDMGTRPSYGWYMRYINGISLSASTTRYDTNDDRPAIIATNGSKVSIDGSKLERGKNSAYDVGFTNIAGYSVTNSTSASGKTLRIKATNSSKS